MPDGEEAMRVQQARQSQERVFTDVVRPHCKSRLIYDLEQKAGVGKLIVMKARRGRKITLGFRACADAVKSV